MSVETAHIVAINVLGPWVVLDDGETLPIVAFHREDGEHCEPEEADVIVAGRDGYGWLTITIEPVRPTIQ